MKRTVIQSLDLLKTKISTMVEINDNLATGNVVADFNKEQLRLMTEEIDALINQILEDEKRFQ